MGYIQCSKFLDALQGRELWKNVEPFEVPKEPSIWCKIFNPKKAKQKAESIENSRRLNQTINENTYAQNKNYVMPTAANVFEGYFGAKSDSYVVGNHVEDFMSIDNIIRDGNISYEEYENYYEKTNADRNLSEEDLKAEAKNIYDAVSDFDGTFSAKRYGALMHVLDEADGKFDGVYDADIKEEIFAKIRKEGADAKVINGWSLKDRIDEWLYKDNKEMQDILKAINTEIPRSKPKYM